MQAEFIARVREHVESTGIDIEVVDANNERIPEMHIDYTTGFFKLEEDTAERAVDMLLVYRDTGSNQKLACRFESRWDSIIQLEIHTYRLILYTGESI